MFQVTFRNIKQKKETPAEHINIQSLPEQVNSLNSESSERNGGQFIPKGKSEFWISMDFIIK